MKEPAGFKFLDQTNQKRKRFVYRSLDRCHALPVTSFPTCQFNPYGDEDDGLMFRQQESKVLKFLGFMWNPLSWVMEAAAIMAIALANGGGKPPDWQDFVGIIVLLLINSTISFIEENNAGNAAAALMAGLAPKTKVKIPPCSKL